MRAPGTRIRRILTIGAAPVAVLLAGLMMTQATSAAFTATTRNAGDNWSAGSVTLTNDSAGVAGFTVTHLTPGQTGTKCMVVTSTSNVPGVVKMYLENLTLTQSKGLEKYIKLTLEPGTGGTFANCTGFIPDAVVGAPVSLVNLQTAMSNFATGGNPWTTAGTPGEKKSYRGTWVFDVTTDALTQPQIDALQGGSVSADFVWELQNT